MKNTIINKSFKLVLKVFMAILLIAYGKYEYNKQAVEQAFSSAKEEFVADKEINKIDAESIKGAYKLIMAIEGDGDWEVSSEFLQGCKNLGWECKRYYQKFPAEQESLLAFKPQIALIMTHSSYPKDILAQLNPEILHNIISFYYMSFSMRSAFDQMTYNPKKIVPYKFASLDGLLVVDENYNVMKKFSNEFKFFSNNPAKNLEFLLFFPSKSETSFKSLSYNSIFYASTNSDHVRGGKKYWKLYSMLDKTSYFSAYGAADGWSKINMDSYKGYLQNIDAEVQKNGIYLLLHGPKHLNEKELGIPTGRIFEAVANSAIIISDKNKFVIDNFGDNVLYIDQNASAEEMFKQIDAHYKWIISNPREAEQKAKKCHEIFIKKFTIEKQLQNLAKMYEFIKKKKSKLA